MKAKKDSDLRGISRRGFLTGTAAACAAGIAPQAIGKSTDGIALRSMPHPFLPDALDDGEVMCEGFGLAPLKAEGQSVSYDKGDMHLDKLTHQEPLFDDNSETIEVWIR